MPAYDPSREELVHVAGDEDTGVQTDHRLTKSAYAQPQIRYKGKAGDYLLTIEVYHFGDSWSANFYCPKCRHSLWIRTPNKFLKWDPERGLFSEPFQCTWENGRDTDGTRTDRMDFGIGMCNWTAAFDGWSVKDA